MFYSTDILNPRKGRLAVVWLMATGSFKCEKPQDRNYRDIISVRISNTCEEILRYVLSGEKRAKGRFSLYLSTMLMFGTVKVYRSQINFLLKEALEFHEKIKGHRLELEEDLSRAGKIVTLRESHVLDPDWTPRAPPARTPAFVTPRKRGSVEKGTTPSRRSKRDSVTPVMREVGMLESEVDVLAQLATDWVEETPTRARAADITLQEDVLEPPSIRITEEEQALMQEVGPLDLGPSFATWEGPIAEQRPAPTIDSVTKRLDLEKDAREEAREEGRPLQDFPLDQQLEIYPLVVPEQPTTTEEPGPLEGAELVLPAMEKTPQQPTKPDDLLRKKGAAPPEALADQTTEVSLQVPTPKPPEPIELRLEPLLEPAVAAPVRRRRRRLRIDKNIAISTTEIRAQIEDYVSTVRCETSAGDVANLLELKRVPGVRLLTDTSHRPMSTRLTNLLKSRYMTQLAPLEDWDFLPTARRQLKLDDMSREEPRATSSLLSVDLSHIADGSVLHVSHLDTSKGSSSRSIHLTPKTAQLEPVAPLSILQETAPLLPIQEEQGLEIFPPLEPEAPPAAPLMEPAPPIQETLQVEAELPARVSTPKPARGPPPRPDVRVQSGFEDIGLATPPGMSLRTPRVTTYVPPEETPVRGPLRSPEDCEWIASPRHSRICFT
ncbi:meiotic recombination protein REC8 homolog isoform X2 [Cherax quadricarinatus]|uniref:meiotic recombination protein REC8 homolog isoform X2 n=1 Tax=Cherax quadricarinatus TaxID=27406 RepID=UPI00387E9858